MSYILIKINWCVRIVDIWILFPLQDIDDNKSIQRSKQRQDQSPAYREANKDKIREYNREEVHVCPSIVVCIVVHVEEGQETKGQALGVYWRDTHGQDIHTLWRS